MANTDKYVFGTVTKQKHEDLVEEKIQLLYDFYVLSPCGRYKARDEREDRVRAMLSKCKTESEMMQKIRDAIHGVKTIDKILEANA